MLNFKEIQSRKQKLIYLLCDPRKDSLLCYVGQTSDPKRFDKHMARTRLEQINDTSSKAKISWISDLREKNLEFVIYPLEICNGLVANTREWEWIGRLEVSPFHILTNSLIDRAIGAAIIGAEAYPISPGIKPRHLATVNSLFEIYAHFASKTTKPEGIVAGYKLLREKSTIQVTDEAFLKATSQTTSEFWQDNLGVRNFDITVKGAKGEYLADEIRQDQTHDLPIELTNYVPWALKKSGIDCPDQIRRQSRDEMRQSLNVGAARLPSEGQGASAEFRLKYHTTPISISNFLNSIAVVAKRKTLNVEIDTSNNIGQVNEAKAKQIKESNSGNMSASVNSIKKFERWSKRLYDPSSEVRQEAAEQLGEIAQDEPSLASNALSFFAMYINENRFDDLFWVFNAIADIPHAAVASNSNILNAIVSAQMLDDLETSKIGDILLNIVEGCELKRDPDTLMRIFAKAKVALTLSHHGGRRSFMKIIDWAEDNTYDI